MLYGYLYFRENNDVYPEGVCEFGKTNDLLAQGFRYSSWEFNLGAFTKIVMVPLTKMSLLERIIKNLLENYHIKTNDGSDFYDKIILNEIEKIIQDLNTEYSVLDHNEINKSINRLVMHQKKIVDTIRKNIHNIDIKSIKDKYQSKYLIVK